MLVLLPSDNCLEEGRWKVARRIHNGALVVCTCTFIFEIGVDPELVVSRSTDIDLSCATTLLLLNFKNAQMVWTCANTRAACRTACAQHTHMAT